MVTEWVRNTISGTLEAAAEGVIFTLVVVVTHVVAAGSIDFDVFPFDSDFFGRSATFVLGVVCRVDAAGSVDLDVFLFDSDFFGRSATLVTNVVSRVDATAIIALGYVKLVLEALVSCLPAVDANIDSLIVSATAAFNVNIDSLIVSAAAAFDVDVDLGISVFGWSAVTSNSR
jgi:hypothetical protein